MEASYPLMTQEAEAAAPAPHAQARPSGIDLVGPTYLVTIGVVMTAWIGGLIWVGIELVRWLIS
jgi:hypothetical protein